VQEERKKDRLALSKVKLAVEFISGSIIITDYGHRKAWP
jgi:hypothetical protein